MTDTLDLLEKQKAEMEAERAKMDADISDLDAAIKAIKSRRSDGAATPSKAKVKAPKPKAAKPQAAKTTAPNASAAKTTPAPKKATAAKSPAKPAAKTKKATGAKVSLDDAIIKAVGSGQSTPVSILEYVTSKMSLETTINSVRTRVSRLKRDGKLTRGKDGWSLPTS